MTVIKFYKQNNNFVKLKATGHTGYAEQGKDILCASVSSILGSLAIGLKMVLNLKIKYKENETDGSMLIEMPQNLNQEKLQKSNLLFEVAYVSLKDLKSGYSNYIKLEVID